MEETLPEESLPQQPPEKALQVALGKKEKKELPEVIAVRNWKEYVGESTLIIFSVLLALILTEFFNSLHEKQQTREILHQLKEELITNSESVKSQYAYHLEVFKKIDSAEQYPAIAQKFLNNGAINLSAITPPPHGIMLHDINDVAWQAAKQNNIVAKIDLRTYSLLTDIYDNQARFANLEPEIGKILLSYESRRPENLKITLILVHDAFYAWTVERVPNLLNLYKRAIDKLAEY